MEIKVEDVKRRMRAYVDHLGMRRVSYVEVSAEVVTIYYEALCGSFPQYYSRDERIRVEF